MVSQAGLLVCGPRQDEGSSPTSWSWRWWRAQAPASQFGDILGTNLGGSQAGVNEDFLAGPGPAELRESATNLEHGAGWGGD